MITKLAYSAEVIDNDGTIHVINPSYIISVTQGNSVEFQSTYEFITGVAKTPSATIVISKKASNSAGLATLFSTTYDWKFKTINIYTSYDGQTRVTLYSGLLTSREESKNTLTFSCLGYLHLFDIYKIKTPLFHWKKAATYIPDVPTGYTQSQIKTLLDAQNPTIKEGVEVGVINTMLWLLGGRPLKYKSLYTSNPKYINEVPKFYFDCDSSSINPEWIWFNYENLLSDLGQLCLATGGLLTQTSDGTIKYINTYNFYKNFDPVTGVSLTDSNYSDIIIETSKNEPLKSVLITFTPRYLSSTQVVYNDNLNEYLKINQTLQRTLEFTKPVYYLLNNTTSGQLTDTIVSNEYQLTKDTVTAVSLSVTKIPMYLKVEPYTDIYIAKPVYDTIGTVEQDLNIMPSQSVDIYFYNNEILADSTIHLTTLTLYGRALEAGNTQTYINQITISGAIQGYRQIKMNDNPYIQSLEQAKRFVDVTKYLLENPKPTIQLTNVSAKYSIELGDTIKINSNLMGISNQYYKVMSKTATGSNFDMFNYSAISLSGMYSKSDTFVVGNSYISSAVKLLAF